MRSDQRGCIFSQHDLSSDWLWEKRERNQRRLQDLGAGQQKDGVAIYKTGKTRMSSVSGGGEQVRVGFLSCAVKSPD